MFGYKKDFYWAEGIAKIAQDVSQKVSSKENFNEILNYICKETYEIATSLNYGKLKGDCRTKFDLYDKNARGCEYFERYKTKILETNKDIYPKSNQKYKEANTCCVGNLCDDLVSIVYPCKYIDTSNLNLCKRAYDELISKENPTEEEILETCAVIHWLMYQECPFWKGNDAIANILSKGIMHSYGIEISPLKSGVSLDFEAFDTDLDEYIKNYPTFFEKYPKKLKT